MIPADLPDILPGVSAGAYLQRRRLAAGVSVHDVSMLYVGSLANAPAAEMLIADFEADRAIAGPDALGRIARSVKFARHIYQCLAEDLPVPTLCRRCACSWDDPCDDDERGPCGWSSDPTLCTHCEDPR